MEMGACVFRGSRGVAICSRPVDERVGQSSLFISNPFEARRRPVPPPRSDSSGVFLFLRRQISKAETPTIKRCLGFITDILFYIWATRP